MEEFYGYDHENRLTGYLKRESGVVTANLSYAYLPTGSRLNQVNLLGGAGNEEWYFPEGADVAADYVRTSGGGGFAPGSTYVNAGGVDGKVTRLPAGGGALYYVPDLLGSVHRVVDEALTVRNTNLTTAWGERLPTFGGSPGVADRYGFTQRETDLASGLMHFRARAYDPRTGRFTQTDPILGNRATEHYAYAGNNPVSRVDPMGEQWKVAQGPGTAAMIRDLQKYTGRSISVDANGTAWFSGTASGSPYASSADMDWIWRVQGDGSNTDLAVLWRHVTNGDEWHRERFKAAWTAYSGQQGAWEAFDHGGAAGLHGFYEGASMGTLHQAPNWARETPGFDTSRRIGTATIMVEAGLAGGAGAVGLSTPVGSAGTALLGGATSLLPGAAAAATGAAVTPTGQGTLRTAQNIVLGLRDQGLRGMASQIPGATHLLDDENWRRSLMTALADSSSRFTVILNGFSGSTVREMVTRAAQAGATPVGRATEWEMAQLWATGRLGDVTFILNGVVQNNPFK